jgi:hypothetical protein
VDIKLISISAGILSVIGALIIVPFLGLSFYTVILLPAFIIVLIFNIRGTREAKAVWLGFLLFLFFSTYTAEIFGTIVRFSLLILFGISILLVFTSLYSREDPKQEPPKSLRIMTAFFFVIVIAVQLYKWSLDDMFVYFLLNEPVILKPPEIYTYKIFQIISYILLVIFLFSGNRFVFYTLAPIMLVLTLLFASDDILRFFRGHILFGEITNYVNLAYLRMLFRESKILLLFFWASLAMTLLFFSLYKQKPILNKS